MLVRVALPFLRVSGCWLLLLFLLLLLSILPSSTSTTEASVVHPLCEALSIPAVSSTHLWNSGTSSSSRPRTLSLAQSLRTGLRTRPRWTYWKLFMDSIHQCFLDKKAIRVGILTLSSESGMVEYWQQELLRLLLGNNNYNFTIQLTAFTEQPDCDLQDQCNNLDGNLDLLIDARIGGFQPSNANAYSTMLVPDYDTALSRQKQSWIREWLENTRTVMILLDPTLGKGHWQNMEYTRTLQLFADWYQIPFLSLAAHSNQEKHPWKLSLELALFAILDFTILFCHGTMPSSTSPSPLLKPEAQYRAEYVLPPPLDTSLSWQDVTRRWESAQFGTEGSSLTP